MMRLRQYAYAAILPGSARTSQFGLAWVSMVCQCILIGKSIKLSWNIRVVLAIPCGSLEMHNISMLLRLGKDPDLLHALPEMKAR